MKTKEFKIETLKWEWSKEVKNPNVYRDDEFVISDSKEEALGAIDFLLNQSKGLTYTITVKREDKYFTYFRHTMPCLGGLVKYRDSHGPEYFMNPYFPRDIRVAFPEGEIIYIAYFRDMRDIFTIPYNEFIFSEESPWKAAFGVKDSVIFKDKYFVLTNMDTDPTVFYSLMRLGNLMHGGNAYKNFHPKADILLSKSLQADPRRLAGQKPIKTSGGTWAEGFGYTRPYNESIFKTELPAKLKDFGSLPNNCYPSNIKFDNQYFISEMKDKFGVDATPTNNKDPKLNDALVEAWDYFKKEADKLKE